MFLSQKKLFKQKKKKEEVPKDQAWAIVILKPLRTEIRGDLIQRISEAFSISQDEAENVVSNTPNILLDELNQATAVKIKDYFRATGAEMFLTNDTFVKSKCYRTVWPEKPDLSDVLGADEEEKPKQVISQAPKELLKSEEEIIKKFSRPPVEDAAPAQSIMPEAPKAPEKPSESESTRSRKTPSVDPEQFKAKLHEEAKSLLDNSSKEEESQAPAPESTRDDLFSEEHIESEDEVESKQSLSQLSAEESKQVLKYFTQWKENYDAWKDNFVALTSEVDQLKRQRESFGQALTESREKIQDGIKEIQLQKSLLSDLQEKRKSAEGNLDSARQEFNERIGTLSKEIGTWKRKSEEIQQRIGELESEKSALSSNFDQQEQSYKELQEDYDDARNNFEMKLNLSIEVLNQWKAKVNDMNEQMTSVDTLKSRVERQLREQRKQYEQLEQDYEKTKRFAGKKVMIPEDDYEDWKSKEKAMSARLEKLEKLQMQLIGDLKENLAPVEKKSSSINKKK